MDAMSIDSVCALDQLKKLTPENAGDVARSRLGRTCQAVSRR